METTDELQNLISDARAKLSKESREAIDNVNWKLTILGMNQMYTTEQLEDLEIETELLLCGILNPEDYPVELEYRMHLPKEQVTSLINEMDKLVFKKIQEELEKIVSRKNVATPEIKQEVKTTPLDPRFASLPKETQTAISKSDYQKNIYLIGEKYKLTIAQMGELENTTIKVMGNTISPDKYENELASKITIPKEDITNLVKDINELIFKKIRELMQKRGKINYEELRIKNEGQEIPLPPYAKVIKNEELGISSEDKTQNTPNVLEEKLKGPTVSKNTVSNYSNTKTDPYREAF